MPPVHMELDEVHVNQNGTMLNNDELDLSMRCVWIYPDVTYEVTWQIVKECLRFNLDQIV